jgi:hypothetical protein
LYQLFLNSDERKYVTYECINNFPHHKSLQITQVFGFLYQYMMVLLRQDITNFYFYQLRTQFKKHLQFRELTFVLIQEFPQDF